MAGCLGLFIFIFIISLAYTYLGSVGVFLVVAGFFALGIWAKKQEQEKLKESKKSETGEERLQREINALKGFSRPHIFSDKPIKTTVPKNKKVPTTQKSASRRVSKREITFWYTDAEGNFSIRRVRLTSVNETYINGYDLDKKATRTFRLDRMENIVDIETGEILTEYDLIYS